MSINFILPGMYEHHKMLFNLLKLKQECPEYFLENLNISAIYGNFQFCIWDGGRIFSNYKHTTREEIKEIQFIYNNIFKVPIRFVFTNSELKEEHLHDRFCNMIMRECENDMNEIVVNSSLLENYIREKYPKYKIISSTTKCLSNPEEFKKEISNNKYYMVCLDYNLNKNLNLLNSLNNEEKIRCEFLVNAVCPSGCPSRKEHYRLNSLFSLSYGKNYKTKVCGIRESHLISNQKTLKNNLSQLECLEYVKMGFNNFKLEGRTFNKNALAITIIQYIVKPEYQLYVLNELLR